MPITSPYSLKNAALTIDVDDFTAAVSQVQFNPRTQSSTWRGISGNTIRDQAVAEWDCQLGLAQDLAPSGLLRYLLDHDGEQKDVVFTPVETEGGNDLTIEATLVISAATIGGTAGADVTTATATCAVIGKPEFVDPT
ncbi:hypothetical protein EXU48_15690 [Occultella glacieicola]|uniref:Uncharacterized protein n=1 Tax=Occultella glacieicola TaxID=2518684 RepID=A0ABY2E244_9MICO|nr:hypothetical protein [Occultella glacieicola]TDE91587.1 hypothetical protein EXU48_15690 [Occultella glacieicola]